jgi:hypothetical protein
VRLQELEFDRLPKQAVSGSFSKGQRTTLAATSHEEATSMHFMTELVQHLARTFTVEHFTQAERLEYRVTGVALAGFQCFLFLTKRWLKEFGHATEALVLFFYEILWGFLIVRHFVPRSISAGRP